MNTHCIRTNALVPKRVMPTVVSDLLPQAPFERLKLTNDGADPVYTRLRSPGEDEEPSRKTEGSKERWNKSVLLRPHAVLVHVGDEIPFDISLSGDY